MHLGVSEPSEGLYLTCTCYHARYPAPSLGSAARLNGLPLLGVGAYIINRHMWQICKTEHLKTLQPGVLLGALPGGTETPGVSPRGRLGLEV